MSDGKTIDHSEEDQITEKLDAGAIVKEFRDTNPEQKTMQEIEALNSLLAVQQEALEKDRKALRKTMQKLEKMKVKTIIPSEVAVDLSRRLGPLDDVFFNKLGESKEAIGEVISTVLEINVIVREVIPQYTIAGIGHRGVRLDSFSSVIPRLDPLPQTLVQVELGENCYLGQKGALVNIEVQKDNNDDFEYRVFYNGASIIVNNTPAGTEKFADIPRAVIIFISDFDVFKEEKMYYEVQKSIKGSGTPRRSPVTEIYINTKYEDRTDVRMSKITDLMKLFNDPDAYDNERFPKFSQRKYFLKHKEEGVHELSVELQQVIDNERNEAKMEGIKEGQQKATVNYIKNIVDSLGVSVDKAMDSLKIPQSQRAMYSGMLNND